MARTKFETFLAAIRGYGVAEAAPLEDQYPRMYRPGTALPIFPYSEGLDTRVWWGSGTSKSAEQVARDGVNLMSSTLVSEADGSSLGELQAAQIKAYREAWADAGHNFTPRVSVSRSVFPIIDGEDKARFGLLASDRDQIGLLEGNTRTTFGRTYAAEPDVLIEQLKEDPAIAAADTLMLTISNQLGVDANVRILENFATYFAPELGWLPNTEGPVTEYDI